MHDQVKVPPVMVGVMVNVTLAPTEAVVPLMTMVLSSETDPPDTLPTMFTVSPAPADADVPSTCAFSEIEVRNPLACRINSDTLARTV